MIQYIFKSYSSFKDTYRENASSNKTYKKHEYINLSS